jgi:hypothetical protein
VFPCYSASLTEQKYLSEAGEQIESIRRSTEAIVVIGGGVYGFCKWFQLLTFST